MFIERDTRDTCYSRCSEYPFLPHTLQRLPPRDIQIARAISIRALAHFSPLLRKEPKRLPNYIKMRPIYDILPLTCSTKGCDTLTFFIYSRKSVYTGKGDSIENQIEMCRQFISLRYPDTPPENIFVYEDEGFSGKDLNRPQFQKMHRDFDLLKPDFLVCYRLDRISRSIGDFATLFEELDDKNIAFLCIKENFDTSSPMGKAMLYITSVFAQLERETIAERVRDNMLLLARTGRWLGGPAPLGFTSAKSEEVVVDGKKKTSCHLKDNPQEIDTVKRIFAQFLTLQSVSGVSKYLIRENILSRSGKHFSLIGIKEILQNPVYCTADQVAYAYFSAQNADLCFEERACSDTHALMVYNKRDYKKSRAPRQPIENWIVAMGKHRGHISGEQWVQVQQILKDNTPTGKHPAKMHNDYSLLSGMIYCDKCGSRMFAKRRSGKGANSEQFDYVCNNKLRGGASLCDSRNLNGLDTDALVCNHLLQYADDDSAILTALQALKEKFQGEERDSPLEKIDVRVAQCHKEIDNLVHTLSHDSLGTALIQRLNARVEELEQELAQLQAQRKASLVTTHSAENREEQLDLVLEILSNFHNNFDTLSLQDRRSYIKILTEKIRWDGEDLHIFIYGE